MKLTQIFKQRKATLYNGEVVKFGDKVSFINSDKVKIYGIIKRRKDGTLFFHNNCFDIKEYRNLKKLTHEIHKNRH